MAIYHVNIKSYSRGKGHSSVAAAAYRAGFNLRDTKNGTVHKYKGRGGIVCQEMLAPKGAPEWCLDVRSFWDINEMHETRSNARLAREVEISLPNSLDSKQRHHLAIDLGRLMVDRYQVAVLVAVHAPSKKGDQRNHHVHLLLSARKVDATGLGERACAAFDARQGAGAAEMKILRGKIASVINAHLIMASVNARVDHRTLRAQAADKARQGLHEEARALSRDPIRRIPKDSFYDKKKARQAVSAAKNAPSVAGLRFTQNLKERREAQEAKFVHPVPETHTHEAALRDRNREGRSHGKTVKSAEQQTSTVRDRIHTRYNPLTRQVSKVSRLSRSKGASAEVLNKQAELIEQWLEAQREVAEQALEILNSIPGIQIEPCFDQAYALIHSRRADHYGGKGLLFEDTKVLGKAMVRYARMLVSPYRAQCDYLAAKAKLTEFDYEPPSAAAARARRRMLRMKHLASATAMKCREWRLGQARSVMSERMRQVDPSMGSTMHGLALEHGHDTWAKMPSGEEDPGLRPTRPRMKFR